MFRKQKPDATCSTAPLLKEFHKQDALDKIKKEPDSGSKKVEKSSRDLQFLSLIKSGDVRKASHLLAFGADVNFQDSETGKTALMIIAENKNLSFADKGSMTKLLFSASSDGSSINANLKDKKEKTALAYFIADALEQNNMHDGIILVANITNDGAAKYQELVTTFELARESERIMTEKQQHEEEPPKSKWFCC